MKKLLFVVVWVLCGYFNYGYTLGYLTNRFPAQSNVSVAVSMAATGPFGVPATFIAGDTKHWLLKPKSEEERWASFHILYPHLSREYFERSGD